MSSKGQIGHFNTRGQYGDFNIPMGPIKKVRAKRLKEAFGNLAKSFIKEMHQKWVKKEKRKPNEPTIETSSPRAYL